MFGRGSQPSLPPMKGALEHVLPIPARVGEERLVGLPGLLL
jgi:hypothetical protein